MKEPSLKEGVLTLVLLPVAVMQLVFGHIQCFYYHVRYLVAKCHHRCDEYMLMRLDLPKSLDALVERDELDIIEVENFMKWVWALTADQVAQVRRAGESIGIGPDVVATHPDRHLYSVLTPSKYENYVRIRNLVYQLQPDIRRRFLADMAELIQQH